MNTVLSFLSPSEGRWAWGRSTFVLVLGSLAFVWLLAFVLARVRLFSKRDAELKVYFAWMVAFTIHSLLATVLLLGVALHCRTLAISPVWCIPHLLLVITSGSCGLTLNGKIGGRLARIERKRKER